MENFKKLMQPGALDSKLQGTREPSTEGQSQCDPGLERSGGSRDCNGFLATRTRRRLAARCRCTAVQLEELRQPDRCIFI